MISVLSVDNMRRSDAHTIATEVPSRELMYRAGEAIFKCVRWHAPVSIVCGSGNNAGDGYVIALLLRDSGIPCTLYLLSEKFSEDGRYYFDRCKEKAIGHVLCDESTSFPADGTVVDCIFGTGFHGDVSDPAKSIIEKINRSGAYVVSVDINSGLSGNSGVGTTVVQSDLTVSVGSYQPGHFLNMADHCMKARKNCDIGIDPVMRPYLLMEEEDIRDLLRDFERGEDPRLPVDDCRRKGTDNLADLSGDGVLMVDNVTLRAVMGEVAEAKPIEALQQLASRLHRTALLTGKTAVMTDGSLVFLMRDPLITCPKPDDFCAVAHLAEKLF